VVVPLPVSVLPTVLPHEVGCEIGRWAMQNMKVCKEEKCNGSDRTELDVTVPDGPMFVHTTMLFVFGIVGEDSKDLSSASSSAYTLTAWGTEPTYLHLC
jgi:hypothetical protein